MSDGERPVPLMAAGAAAVGQHAAQATPNESGGLTPEELQRQLLEDSPADATEEALSIAEAPDALAPYLSVPPDFSREAYEEWLDRVCEQPPDRD